MFKTKDEAIVRNMGEGVTRNVLLSCGKLMAVRLDFRKGAVVNQHSHPHEQIGYIVQGSFEFTIGGETKILKTGDSYYMPSNVVHGAKALEESVAIDIFTPIREDYL
jgi:quercetin dioxygenase-like cupin family protein